MTKRPTAPSKDKKASTKTPQPVKKRSFMLNSIITLLLAGLVPGLYHLTDYILPSQINPVEEALHFIYDLKPPAQGFKKDFYKMKVSIPLPPLKSKTFIDAFGKEGILSDSKAGEVKEVSITAHKVATEDGYILTVFKVTPDRPDPALPPVYFQHGLGGQLMSHFTTQLDSFAIQMARKGYIVYVPGTRGTPLCTERVEAKKDEHVGTSAYWDFDTQDLPFDFLAVLEFINKDQGKKAMYVGHSQGGMGMIFGLADPKFKDKLKSLITKFYGLAPVICVANHEMKVLKFAKSFDWGISLLRSYLGFNKLGSTEFKVNSLRKTIARGINWGCAFSPWICQKFIQTDGDATMENIDFSVLGTFRMFSGNAFPSKSVLLFNQMIQKQIETNSCIIPKFDYGSESENLNKYGSKLPPELKVSSLNLPSQFLFAESDLFTVPSDIFIFHSLFKENQQVSLPPALPLFGHMGFILGRHKAGVYEGIHRDYQDWVRKAQTD